MTMKDDFLKEVHDIATNARSALVELMRLNIDSEIPNQVVQDEHTQFNIVLGEPMKFMHINFSVYLANINAYMLDLVAYFPQDDIHFPPEVTQENALFTISGSPLLGHVSYQKPIAALSLEEALEASLEYVHDNIEDIVKDAMGGSTI